MDHGPAAIGGRISPAVIRAFEAGPEGLELVAFGPHRRGDAEIVQGWWSD